MKSSMKKVLLTGMLIVSGAIFAAEDYYSCLDRVETWLGQRYDKSSLVYKSRRRKLEQIAGAEVPDAEKLKMLKKEFPDINQQKTLE